MNIFVEGLQGSGKSTMVQRLSEANKAYSPVMEGEYSPILLSVSELEHSSITGFPKNGS